MALYVAHAHRHDTLFSVVLNGPPRPPVTLTISGDTLRDVRIDERSWGEALQGALSGTPPPGFTVERSSFQAQVRRVAGTTFVLGERAPPLDPAEVGTEDLFVIGDYIGLPPRDEDFALRRGRKVSLGRVSYMASQCIALVHYLLDTRGAPTEVPPAATARAPGGTSPEEGDLPPP